MTLDRELMLRVRQTCTQHDAFVIVSTLKQSSVSFDCKETAERLRVIVKSVVVTSL